MGFASVYGCLQELFPQLDARLLKAIAIENSKDADAAVGVVLSQILPCMTENATSRSPLGNLGSQSRVEEEVQEEDQSSLLRRLRIVEKVNSSESKLAANADVHASSSSTDGPARPALINKALFWGDTDNSIDQSHESFGPEALAAPTTAEETMAASLNLISQAQLVAAMHHFDVAKVSEELNGTAESEEQILSGMKNKPLTSTVQTSHVATPFIPNADEADSETSRSRTDEKGSKITHAHSADGSREHHLGRSKSIFLPNVVCELEPVSVQKRDPDTDITEDVSAEYLNDIDIIIAGASDATSTIEEVGVEDALSVTRSTQIREVDLLEQIIGDAKKSKKILFSAMASVVNTMKEVEEREKAAKQASEEAAPGSSDVCRKVEELKGMIRSAKEANDMHAGEIYGERAILATEMRELQFRLLNLSDERDGSLAILDEMQSTLETRLTAAQVVIEAAECEKHAKLGSATNALKEQETLMEKMVHESKMLQAEAEKNSKLREFLMDRGRLVDQLQGEIAVVCQYVKLLKEKFNSGAALSKSISFGQTSCILASSSSSLNSSASSGRVPVSRKGCKAPNEASPGSSVDRSSLRSDPEDENATGAGKKQLVDRGWELCEN